MKTIRLIAAAALMVLAVTPLTGQGLSRSADASATVVITPVLNLTKTTDLDFGQHFSSDGLVFSSTEARWDGLTDQGGHISVSFTALPSSLNRVGGGDAVGISYGTSSAAIMGTGSTLVFNPAGGVGDFGPIVSPGSFSIRLGLAPNSDNGVSVNLSGHRAGTYQSTITLTVVVL